MSEILIVEDDVVLAETVIDALGSDVYQIEHAASAGAALKMLAAKQYDLVLLDWQLPDLDGIVLLQKFREQGTTTNVIMLTGHKQTSLMSQALDAGAQDVLNKPFSVRELRDRVKALLP